uniref:Sulfotransferase domain-containing protein n=1 Tax=Ditylum brightwellii TaxID=49249 RepID=A0A6U4AF06_9STRA|mmetsp:Transcript_31775/g.47377  ORF Transcript_31775/g.47377 Transcript_31775/m.47377 type:complete len:487 (+) Transcript_31775:106-1566(+)
MTFDGPLEGRADDAPSVSSLRKLLKERRKLRYFGLVCAALFISLHTSFDTISRARRMLGLQNYITGTPFENLRDVEDTFHHPEDIPLFFLVPKSATSTVKSILSHCLHLNQASSTQAVKYEEPKDVKELELVPINNGEGGAFLNVDFAWPKGIARAKELNLASSGLADVVVTSYIREASELFDEDHQGRLFTVLRHPIKRLVSDYYYMQDAEWENLYSEDERPQSLIEYAQNPKFHLDNFLTRFLSGNRSSKITLEDYELAKEVLATKTLVLVQGKMEESVDRLLSYFRWNDQFVSSHDETTISNAEKCIDGYINAPVNQHLHEDPEPGSEEWEALREISDWDIHLYWFGIELWESQGKSLFKHKQNANGFREEHHHVETADEDEELRIEEELYLQDLEESEAEWYAKKQKEEEERVKDYSKKISSVFEDEDKEIDEKKKNVLLMIHASYEPTDNKIGVGSVNVKEYVTLKKEEKGKDMSWLSIWK